jgi:hypothetical protein
MAQPSIRQKERKPFLVSRSKNPKKQTVFLPALQEYLELALGKKVFHGTSMKACFMRFWFGLFF